MNKPLQPLKGFKDRYPEDKALLEYIFSEIRCVAETYGFQEYDGPMVEPIELYEGKTSKELLEDQSFTLTDKKGRITMLRPEMTPTLARMVAQRSNELTLPIRLFTIGQRFRYEAPQKGRAREFYQMDFDILGSNSTLAEVEILAVLVDIFTNLGASTDDFTINVNSRDIMNTALKELGIPTEKITDLIAVIDKRDKVDEKTFVKLIEKTGLSESQSAKVLELLDSDTYAENFAAFMNLARAYGLADYITINPSIVRGLDYYTGIVFEVTSKKKGINRSLLGGGRYDNLVKRYGKTQISGVGFALSDTILLAFLEDIGQLPKVEPTIPDFLVTVFSDETARASLSVAKVIRTTGASCELYPDTAKLGKQLTYANKRNIPFVIVIGPDEMEKTSVVIKDMEREIQETVSFKDLPEKIASLVS